MSNTRIDNNNTELQSILDTVNALPDADSISVQSDWTQTDDTQKDYIKNKPDLNLKEDKSNKVSEIQGVGNNVSYPNTKAVVDYVKQISGSVYNFIGSFPLNEIPHAHTLGKGTVINVTNSGTKEFFVSSGMDVPILLTGETNKTLNFPFSLPTENFTRIIINFEGSSYTLTNLQFINSGVGTTDYYLYTDTDGVLGNVNAYDENYQPKTAYLQILTYNLSVNAGDNIISTGYYWDNIGSYVDLSGVENKSNKVSSLSTSSTNTQYPSAKSVVDYVSNKISNVYKFKGVMPSAGIYDTPEIGDVYNISSSDTGLSSSFTDYVSTVNIYPYDGYFGMRIDTGILPPPSEWTTFSFYIDEINDIDNGIYYSRLYAEDITYEGDGNYYFNRLVDENGNSVEITAKDDYSPYVGNISEFTYSPSVSVGDNVVWTGYYWDKLASTIDLSPYYMKPTYIDLVAPTEVTLVDNTEYTFTDVTNLTFTFPSGKFESYVTLTTSLDTPTIAFPDSAKYIGVYPTFASEETWEISIKNGVVVAAKVVI